MATKPRLEDDLCCPVCCDIYQEPVVLTCSHSFCQACLKTYWADNKHRPCPVCRDPSMSDSPPLNLALRNLCLSFTEDAERRGTDSLRICGLHGEQLKLFCKQDKQPVCVDCLTSEHRDHKFCTTSEAVQQYKDVLRTALKPLQDRLSTMRKTKETLDHTGELCNAQAKSTESLIKEEFNTLRVALQMEEMCLINELKEEQAKKMELIRSKIEEVALVITSVSETISLIEREMCVDDLAFLQNFQDTVKRTECTGEDPEELKGGLIDLGKYCGNLRHNVWRKMVDTVQYTPILLDPNSAHPMLKVSPGLDTLSACERQNLPDNAERFDTYLQVLGCEGYLTGKHVWEVDVGRNQSWLLGVATESLKRKGTLSPLSPASGFWCIWHRDGAYIAVTSPETQLQVRKKLRRVRVELDMDRGEVAFIDTVGNTMIHKFKLKFKGRIFPLLSTGTDPPLRILPRNVTISSEERYY